MACHLRAGFAQAGIGVNSNPRLRRGHDFWLLYGTSSRQFLANPIQL
jgi:hypothetical protein